MVGQELARLHLRRSEEKMLEYVYRFTIDRGKQNEFIEWLNTNE